MKSVLLLVDLQADYLSSPGLQPTADVVTAHAAALLDGCRKHQISIIHVWTAIHRGDDRRLPHWKENDRWLCVVGTAGHRTPEKLKPLSGETIVQKTGFNAFAGPELDVALKKINCDTVILAGVHLHACVRTAAAECLERGLRVFIAEDAVASNDPMFAAATRRWLTERCVQFEPASAVLSRLNGCAESSLIHRSPRETRQVLFEVPVAGNNEIAVTTMAAQEAWRDWRQTKFSLRRQLLEDWASRLDAAAPDLARQMAIEIGKPISHGLDEVRRAVANIHDVIRRAAGGKLEMRAASGIVRHPPLGIVALISPWNNPVALPIGKIAPALVYGNTVVWKPAPAATKISEVILKLLRAAGAPENAVQLLTGDHTTAQKLATDENIHAVTITSSAPAGYAIQEICARRFLPLQAELSGNNAAIVWNDADLPVAARQIAWGAFGFAGQRCTANRRIIVPGAQFGNFWDELKVAAEKLVWSDPLEEITDIGPVIHSGKRDELAAQISRADVDGGAHRVEFLFKKRAGESWVKNGAYAQPVMVGSDQPHHPLVQEETMSPLLVVQRAEDFDHALKLCNGVRHGLVAALFGRSLELQKKFLAEAQAGILKLNSSTAGADVTLPFCGWKASGIGPPEHGEGDRLFYTRMQTIYE